MENSRVEFSNPEACMYKVSKMQNRAYYGRLIPVIALNFFEFGKISNEGHSKISALAPFRYIYVCTR